MFYWAGQLVSMALVLGGAAQPLDSDALENPVRVSPTMDMTPIVTTWDAPRPVNRGTMRVSRGTSNPCTTFLSMNSDPEGDMPRDVEFTPDGSTAVIVNRDTDNLTFFDIATQSITHTVAVGDFPVDVAVTPNGQFAVTPNVFDNTVSIVDIPTHSLVSNVPITGSQPYQVKVTSDSQFAVVGVINDAVNSSFSVIDLNARVEILSFPSAPQGAFGLSSTLEFGLFKNIFTQYALSPDDTTIVLPDRGNAQVFLYDLTTGSQLAALPTAVFPTSVDISPDGTMAVVGHEGSANTITKIDLVGRTISGSFATSSPLTSKVIRITPDKSHAIAAIANNIIFVNLTTGITTATVSTGRVGDIEISFDGQFAFISNLNSRVIDIASQTLVDTISFAPAAEAASSPIEHRAVALNNGFGADIQLYNTNGASGFFEGFASSGELPEGDGTRNLAISADGQTIVACNTVSRNVSVIDISTATVRCYIDVGKRPRAVEITPDGHFAVVCAMDANQVVIIDLSTDTVAATLPIVSGPAKVRISPDGQFAYVLNIGTADKISFIQIDGVNSFIISQISAGEAGLIGGLTFAQISGIALSRDGAILASCDSFNNLLRLYDTATRTQVAAVPVGNFPIRVVFSPDGTKAYVTNPLGNSVSVVSINGVSSSLEATVPGINFPITVDVDASGSFVYVGSVAAPAGIRVIDASTNSIVQTVLFTSGTVNDTYLSTTDSILYVASSNPEMLRINAAGPASSIIDITPLNSAAQDMVFSEATGTAVFGEPFSDGVDIVASATAGDINADGLIDGGDIESFVRVRLGSLTAPYAVCAADIDANGSVNDIDTTLFVASLLTQ